MFIPEWVLWTLVALIGIPILLFVGCCVFVGFLYVASEDWWFK